MEILELVNSIEDFDNCQLKQNTIVFTYKNNITVKFYKNMDGFGGEEGKISCSLDVFSPRKRKHIYKCIKETPKLIDNFKSYLQISSSSSQELP